MLMVLAFVLGALTVPLAGGRLAALADVRLRRAGLLFGALAIQIVVISVVPGLPTHAASALHLFSYALAGAFLVANRRVAGLWLVALGAAANLLVITANRGVMPASARALAVAGRPAATGEFENSAVLAHPRLPFLGDVFAVPDAWPLSNVFSVGDLLIVAGAVLTLHALCGSRLARPLPSGTAPG